MSTQSPRQFIFTITAGRTGSHFLAELLAANLDEARVFDEIIGFGEYGRNTPDISHLAEFNSHGNSASIRAFWDQKMARILELETPTYVETSHVLAKAGLIENIDLLTQHGTVHLVCLRRDMVKSMINYERNHDFVHKTMWWAWYLDPHYPKNIIEPNEQLFDAMGRVGISLWYLCEIQARQAYYQQQFQSHPNLVFHDVQLEPLNAPEHAAALLTKLGSNRTQAQVRIPPRKNESRSAHTVPADLQVQMSKLVEQMQFDSAELARMHIAAGRGFSNSQTM